MSFIFFFNDTATTEIYTLSLHDALPICRGFWRRRFRGTARPAAFRDQRVRPVARRRARGPRNPVGQWDGGTVGQSPCATVRPPVRARRAAARPGCVGDARATRAVPLAASG